MTEEWELCFIDEGVESFIAVGDDIFHVLLFVTGIIGDVFDVFDRSFVFSDGPVAMNSGDVLG